MENKKKKTKLFIVLGITLLAIVLGGTYAYYRWITSDDEVTHIYAEVGGATVTFDGGSDISANLRPVPDKNMGIVKKITVKGDTEGLTFNMYLDVINIDEGLKDVSFRYALYSGDTIKKEGNFSTEYLNNNNLSSCLTNNTNHLTLLNNESISTTRTEYTLYIWIDGENYDNPSSMMNKTATFKLHAEGTKAILKPTAAQYITNLYNTANKEEATVNNITYHLAPSVNLMNDRHASMSTGIDDGDIRYYGASPNNYVWLGDYYTEDMTVPGNISEDGYESKEACIEDGNSEAYCTEDIEIHDGDKKLWRIVGVFNGKLKLVTDMPISTGGLSWDTSEQSVNNGQGVNEWSQSDLMKLLNPGYENESVNNSLYWNKEEGTVYTSWRESTTDDISFESTGLSEDEQDMIDESTWYIGAYDDWSYADVHYQAERQNMGKICTQGTTYCNDSVARTNTWNGKVGLISVSDFGYSTDLKECNQTMGNYYEPDCIFNTWLKPHYGWEWTVSPRASSSTAHIVFDVGNDGYLSDTDAFSAGSAHPAVYLKSGVTISSGDGSGSDPYVLSY